MPQKPSGRDYRKEYDSYHGKPEQLKNRHKRNAARAAMKAKGVNVEGKDVGHIKALINGGSNSPSNTKVQSIKANRGFKRTAKNKPKK